MNQGVLADIDVAVVRLLDDPGILQPQKAQAEILVQRGRDSDYGRWEAGCLLLGCFHGFGRRMDFGTAKGGIEAERQPAPPTLWLGGVPWSRRSCPTRRNS